MRVKWVTCPLILLTGSKEKYAVMKGTEIDLSDIDEHHTIWDLAPSKPTFWKTIKHQPYSWKLLVYIKKRALHINVDSIQMLCYSMFHFSTCTAWWEWYLRNWTKFSTSPDPKCLSQVVLSGWLPTTIRPVVPCSSETPTANAQDRASSDCRSF